MQNIYRYNLSQSRAGCLRHCEMLGLALVLLDLRRRADLMDLARVRVCVLHACMHATMHKR